MYLRFRRYFLGYVTLEIKGKSPERFLNMCMYHELCIWQLSVSGDSYRFNIMRKDFQKLRPIIRKTKIKIKIIDKAGVPFLLYRYRKRRIFAIGMFTCIMAMLLLSQFIWHIDISGNQYYTDETIVSFLNNNQIQIAMGTRSVDEEEIVSMLRAEFDAIVWVSAHVDGTELVINIKENDTGDISGIDVDLENKDSEDIEDEDLYIGGTDIVASSSGIVTSIVTRSGNALVHIGDVVEVGDVLVTGRLEIYGDYEVLLSYKYVDSDADIGIQTTIEYYDYLDRNYKEKVYLENNKKGVYLHFNEFWFDLEFYNPLELIQEKLNILLTDVCVEASPTMQEIGYYDQTTNVISLDPSQQTFLMVELGFINYQYYELLDAVYSDSEVEKILNSNFQVYCTDLIEKKVEILGNDVKITINEFNAVAEGEIVVINYDNQYIETEIVEAPVDEQEEGMNE